MKSKKRLSFQNFTALLFASLFFYVLLAYYLVPDFWKHYEHHPELEDFPKTSFTAEGLPGDPLNIGLAGSEQELIEAMRLAGWKQADPLKISSDIKIAEMVLLQKSYPEAPVSNLFLFERAQDFAFEKQMGSSPKRRHHVRFWKTPITNLQGQPLWIGSATFDRSVGLSHLTGQITHHIAPDIDQERDQWVQDLMRAGQLVKIYQVSGVGPSFRGKNGAGDFYYTDGEMTFAVLSIKNKPYLEPVVESNPIRVEFKNRSWDFFKHLFQPSE